MKKVEGNKLVYRPMHSALMEPNGVTTVNGATSTTFAVTSNSNPDLKWEVKKTFDAGHTISCTNLEIVYLLDFLHPRLIAMKSNV